MELKRGARLLLAAAACGVLTLHGVGLHAQGTQDAKAIVTAATHVELAADHTDHSAYVYMDHDITPDHDTTSLLVETPQGSLKRKLQDHGHPVSAADRQADDQRILAFLKDPAAQAKAKKDAAHDDDQAEQMLKLLPEAFLWTFVSENGDLATLAFKPDPNYTAQSLEGKVLSGMAGQVIVDRAQNRIYSIKGKLVADVKFGFGILGRLKQGGTFEVERREIAPHHWQMISSRVHIEGHALFFKTIGDQEDETHTDSSPRRRRRLSKRGSTCRQIRSKTQSGTQRAQRRAHRVRKGSSLCVLCATLLCVLCVLLLFCA